jgi:leucyl-tRNA synthetase
MTTTGRTSTSTSTIDWGSIEKKWVKRWQDAKVFESDPDPARPKYFVTVAYPYPNSPQHIGHGRTYTLADAHARYMRMNGYNVLFPMGFHYTGTPILAMSRRVAEGDKELLETFKKVYRVSDDAISSFVEPVKIASYFHNEIKTGMKEMGYSIDWRREFTTIDPLYSKFISWQFRTLQKKGLIVQGSHPVGWCPRDQSPVSQHDTMGDVEPDFNEYSVIKFELVDTSGRASTCVLPAATLRPETIFGVTNLWINPDIEYLNVKIDSGETWLVSRDAARKLEFLGRRIYVESTLMGKDMVGRKAKNPATSAIIPVLPASFVKADSGTGIVMSVPAHAPFDYQALLDLKTRHDNGQPFSLDFEPLKIIESEGYGKEVIPAAEVIKKFGVKSQDDPELEKATNDLYSHEFYHGKMMANTGKFAGLPVSEAKDKIKGDIAMSGYADLMFELVNKPVRCRCGAECVVKILNDQWFINYGDREWKKLAHECIGRMEIIPQEIREEFDYVVDWLRERACARKSGLGTKLPWDDEWIIESLSDSVIYMAYYIIAKYVNNKMLADAKIDRITDVFFDYILLGQGSSTLVESQCGLAASTADRIKDEFCYFYPVDSRHSGRDLVPNHLTFFIFNHVAIFAKDKWPKQMVVNGSVLMEGKKMSKSLGNIIPLRDAIKEHGADAIRLSMLVSAEILQDADFTFDTVKGIRAKLIGIYEMAQEIVELGKTTEKNSDSKPASQDASGVQTEDLWLASRLQYAIARTTASMDQLRVREAIHYVLYSLEQDLQWYRKRVKAKGRDDSTQVASVLREFIEIRTRMLAPFAPFIAHEVWEKISVTPVSTLSWPKADEQRVNRTAEESELLLANLLSDLQNIIKVTKMSPSKIVIYTSSPWKSRVWRSVARSVMEGNANFGDIMKKLISDPETAKAKSDPGIVRKMMEDVLSAPMEARSRRLSQELAEFDEAKAVKDAAGFLTTEAGCPNAEVSVYSEQDADIFDPKAKAKFARPFKPAIYLE